jgi:hypothetical protein
MDGSQHCETIVGHSRPCRCLKVISRRSRLLGSSGSSSSPTHDQRLSDPQLIAFRMNFGKLDPPGPNPYGSGTS